jgi:hypothetical protein
MKNLLYCTEQIEHFASFNLVVYSHFAKLQYFLEHPFNNGTIPQQLMEWKVECPFEEFFQNDVILEMQLSTPIVLRK